MTDQPALNCPQCACSMDGIKTQYDAWLCEICGCTWEISKHEITVGDKIDIE